MKPKPPKAARHQLHVRLDKWTPLRLAVMRERLEKELGVPISTSRLVELALDRMDQPRANGGKA